MNTNERPRSTGRILGRGAAARRLGSRALGVLGMRSMGVLTVVALAPAAFRGVPSPHPAEPELPALAAATPEAALLPPAEPYPGLPEHANDRVSYWIHRFSTDQRPTFEIFLVQETIFGDLIRGELHARGMPEDLLYLAMIESGLRPRATSRVEAAGVWQFMGPTAEAYGLRVDEWVDERRDPVKATGAALDYLQWLYDQYDSWNLAAAAYNAGPTRINRLLRRLGWEGGDGDALYWEILDQLPFETREYVPRMKAAAWLASRSHQHGFHDVDSKDPYDFQSVWVPGGTPLFEVADRLGVDRTVVRALNPHLTQGRTPPGETYLLRVPRGFAFQVVATLGKRSPNPRRVDD